MNSPQPHPNESHRDFEKERQFLEHFKGKIGALLNDGIPLDIIISNINGAVSMIESKSRSPFQNQAPQTPEQKEHRKKYMEGYQAFNPYIFNPREVCSDTKPYKQTVVWEKASKLFPKYDHNSPGANIIRDYYLHKGVKKTPYSLQQIEEFANQGYMTIDRSKNAGQPHTHYEDLIITSDKKMINIYANHDHQRIFIQIFEK